MFSKLFSDLVIKEVYSAYTIYTRQNTSMKRLNRKCWSIGIKYEGQTEYYFNGKSVIADKNHIIILPKGCDYTWKCINSGHYSSIEFDSDLTYPEPISISIKSNEAILNTINKFELRYASDEIYRKIKNIKDVYSIIIEILDSEVKTYSASKKQQKIAPALEYISLHYTERITNDTLAEVSKISNVYFRKLFTEIIGVSPITYINLFRISKAKEMLKSDYGNLSNVALSLGYPDLYTFSRDFKKVTGVSPSNYAKIKNAPNE